MRSFKPQLLACVAAVLTMAATVGADDRQARCRIFAELDKPTQMDFIQVPLEAAVDFLQDLHGIPIRIDTQALEEAGVGTDVPVTRTLQGISLRSGLNLVLGELQLTWIVRDEVLLITSAEAAHKTVSRAVYPVADLIADDPQSADDDEQALLNVLRAALCDDEAPVRFFGRSMILAGDRWQHETTARLLRAIRTDRDKQRPSGTWQAVSLTESPAHVKIRAELDKPTQMDFIQVPLKAAIDFLKDVHGIEIQVDQAALDKAGIGTDQPVTMTLQGVSLRSGLNLLLTPLQLTWVIENEVLLITTQRRAAATINVMVYPVGDLAATDAPQKLDDVIRGTVQPKSWRGEGDEKAGPGALAYFPATQALVCANSRMVQEDVARLLAALRQAAAGGDSN